MEEAKQLASVADLVVSVNYLYIAHDARLYQPGPAAAYAALSLLRHSASPARDAALNFEGSSTPMCSLESCNCRHLRVMCDAICLPFCSVNARGLLYITVRLEIIMLQIFGIMLFFYSRYLLLLCSSILLLCSNNHIAKHGLSERVCM